MDAFVADFAVFDPATGVSTALAPLQQARGNAQMVATDDGRLMVLGGRAFINDEAIVRALPVVTFRAVIPCYGAGQPSSMTKPLCAAQPVVTTRL